MTVCAPRRTAEIRIRPLFLDFHDAFAGIRGADERGHRRQFTEVERLILPGRVDERVADQFGADGGRTDRLNAELAIHLTARRVVDPSHDPFDLKHPLRDERRHDVAVVAVGDRDKPVGTRGAGSLEHVVVDAGADDDVAFKFLPETFEGRGVFVNDDDFVSVGIEKFSKCRTDAAAPDDEVSHERRNSFRGLSALPWSRQAVAQSKGREHGSAKSFEALRGVAQLGRALRSGRRGRTFKSCRPEILPSPSRDACSRTLILRRGACFGWPSKSAETTAITS